MGGSQSREGRLSDSSDSDSEYGSPNNSFHTPSKEPSDNNNNNGVSPSLDLNMASLSLLNSHLPPSAIAPVSHHSVKLYRHVGGHLTEAKWVISEKLADWSFVREDDGEGEGEEEEEEEREYRSWVLIVGGGKVKARVDERLQMKYLDEQSRVDFVASGSVWAIKFLSVDSFKAFASTHRDCLFENTYFLEPTEENKMKVYGKDFVGWAKPEECDDSVWQDAEDEEEDGKSRNGFSLNLQKELKEGLSEPSSSGIKSLTIGALDHSFLMSDSGIEAVRNMPSGIQGKGIAVRFGSEKDIGFMTPQKAMLIRAESNMMILSPVNNQITHSAGIHQLDIGTGKTVAEWRFEKDGTPITMRDVTNDSKGAQLDPSGSTFLGLDDNRLCRWDMRDRRGVVQDIASPNLNWAEGHQFNRGTNFRCFASTGDGAVVVGSVDGKVRLYGTTTMRMAKTVFPGLGSPITHVDVTFDGKWVLATTDTYLILISTVFKDKEGRAKTGFSGRMGSNMAAPRLLKLNPLDAYLAGKNHEFRGGQFSWVTESGRQERHLVATVGKFSVIWNFHRVKDSNHGCYQHAEGLKSCYCYKIVPREESIVDSKFMHDNFISKSPEAPLVVATPKKVSSFSLWNEEKWNYICEEDKLHQENKEEMLG